MREETKKCKKRDLTQFRFRLRRFAIFLACLMGLSAATSIAAQPNKFHLVYLVAADAGRYQAGREVVVEPLFFTNGEKFIFVYDYCRQVMEKKFQWRYERHHKGPHLLRLDEIDDGDREITFSYCDNKSFSLNGDRFYSLNNRGESIKLGKIDFEFSGDGSHDRFIIPPTLPKTGRAKVLDFLGKAQDSKDISAPSFEFFFVGKNEELLKKVLPFWSVNDHAASILLRQAIAYAYPYKGVHRAWVKDYPGCQLNSWCDLQKDGRFKDASIRLTQSLIGDFDGDGAPDAVVGIRAEIETGQEGGGWAWLATVVIHSDGRRAIVSGYGGSSATNASHLGSYLHRNSYRPLGVFRFGACKFLLIIETPVVSLRMLNVSGAAPGCQDASSVREMEDAENEYPPH